MPELSETTIRYLYATSWLPEKTGEQTVAVPGGATTALDTAASLLDIALWSLRLSGTIGLEQAREVEHEPVRTFGERSFSRFTIVDRTARRAGLEGALLRAAASVEPGDGLRRLLRALDLDNRGPWKTVCGHCFAEARAAGLVEAKGRLFKKVMITDAAAVEALRARHDELREARGAYMEAEPELSNAVASDCIRAIVDGHSPHLGDSL